MSKSVPKNKKLYNQVKEEAKKKFKVWPSAYASGWLVKEYKRRGGTYSDKVEKNEKKSKRKSRKSSRKSKRSTRKSRTSYGLGRWYAEEWINVCKLPKIVPCGRPKLGDKDWKKNYPYCRPRKRINSGTPKTSGELSKAEIKKRCSLKKKNPMKRVTKSRVKKSTKKSKKSTKKSKKSTKKSKKSTKKSKKSKKSSKKSTKKSKKSSKKSTKKSKKSSKKSTKKKKSIKKSRRTGA